MAEPGFFTGTGNSLAYCCTIPKGVQKEEGVLFVHAGGGNKLGPHRMFVEFARKFDELGYATFRFDLAGCGDSTGTAGDGDAAAEIVDVIAAADFFVKKSGVRKVILLGISRGAWICFSAMGREELPVAGAVLVSAPVSSGKAAAKAFTNRAKEYLCKLRDPRSLGRLLGGKVDFRQVGRTLGHAVKSGQRYLSPPTASVKSKRPVLLVYGGNDPIFGESMSYYVSRCEENGAACECRVIENANHSFFHYKWKEQVFDIVRDWLSSAIGNGK
jgi:pimeloyl-ACP methyl ester carboxylesterase